MVWCCWYRQDGCGLLLVLLTVSVSRAAEPAGWHTQHNRHYYFSSESLSWTAAQESCEAMGAQLTPLEGATEAASVSELLGDSRVEWWVGISSRQNNSEYRRTDGLVYDYDYWFPGYSNGHNKQPTYTGGCGDQECVELRRWWTYTNGYTYLWSKFYWNDQCCDMAERYICSLKACGFSTSSSVQFTTSIQTARVCSHDDRRLEGSVITMVTARTRVRCVAVCLRTAECESVNYEAVTGACELNGRVVETVDGLMAAAGYSFYSANVNCSGSP